MSILRLHRQAFELLQRYLANTINAFNGLIAPVHDSFATHASEVGFLKEVTALTFIAQYDVENFFDIIDALIVLAR